MHLTESEHKECAYLCLKQQYNNTVVQLAIIFKALA